METPQFSPNGGDSFVSFVFLFFLYVLVLRCPCTRARLAALTSYAHSNKCCLPHTQHRGEKKSPPVERFYTHSRTSYLTVALLRTPRFVDCARWRFAAWSSRTSQVNGTLGVTCALAWPCNAAIACDRHLRPVAEPAVGFLTPTRARLEKRPRADAVLRSN